MSPNPRDVQNAQIGTPGVPAEEGIDLASVEDDLQQAPEEKKNRTDGADGTDSPDSPGSTDRS
jgi:hypothetical protein